MKFLYSWNTNNLGKAEQSLPLDLLMEKLYSTLHGNKERTIQEIYNFQSSYNTNRSSVFFWVSDFQSSTSGDLSNLDIDSTHSYYLIPLKPTLKANISIDSVWLEKYFMTFRDKNTCFIKLRNLSKELVSEEVVQLFIEDKQVGAKTVEIEGMSELIVPISFIARDTGTIRGKISIEDYPITFDDDFYFTFDIAPSVNVAIISSSITKNLIAKAYQQDEIFDIQLWNETTIDFLKLPTMDIIIFDRVNNFSDNLILSLEQLLDNNQSIVIIPSEKDKKLSYKNLFKRIDIRYMDAGDISKDRYTLKVPAITNPLFKDVFERISSTYGYALGSANY